MHLIMLFLVGGKERSHPEIINATVDADPSTGELYMAVFWKRPSVLEGTLTHYTVST